MRLADAVRTVGCLVLGGGVPPGIVMNHQVRAGQVQPRASCLQRNQEHPSLSPVEAIAQLLTLVGAGFTIQVKRLDTLAPQALADHLQHTHKLRKDQHAAFGGDGVVHDLHQQLQLSAGALIVGQKQFGVAAYLTELEQNAEHLHARARQGALRQRLPHMLAQRQHQAVVHARLFGGHGGIDVFLSLSGQVGQHLALEAAHQEGADALAQLVGPLASAIAAQKCRLRAQVSRQHEIKDAPQLAGVIFHGGAGQRHAHLRVQLLGGHRPLALRVFHALCLIQYGKAQGDVPQVLNIAPQKRIAGQHHVHRRVALDLLDGAAPFLPRSAHHAHHHRVVKTLEFGQPVIGQRRGGDDHALHHAVPAPGRRQRRDDLHRFAQAHLVGQNAAHARLVERQDPCAPALLIGRELAPQAAGHIAQIRLRIAAQRFHNVFHAFVSGHVRTGHAQHAHHIGGAVRAEAELPRLVVRRRVVQGGRIQQFLYHGSQCAHIAHIQKFARFQPYILLPLGDGAHHRQQFRHRPPFLQQLKHQPSAAHMERGASSEAPGLDLFKRRGGIDLAQLAQLRHALGAESQNLLGSLEYDASAAHHEARV